MNALLADLAAREEARLELREIEDRGIHAAGRGDAEFERRRRELAAVIRPHHRVRELLLHRGRRHEGTRLHAEHVEHACAARTSRNFSLCDLLQRVADDADRRRSNTSSRSPGG